jgi:hypothetical protein
VLVNHICKRSVKPRFIIDGDYLPQATEEDHGAHPFKGRAGIAALTFA